MHSYLPHHSVRVGIDLSSKHGLTAARWVGEGVTYAFNQYHLIQQSGLWVKNGPSSPPHLEVALVGSKAHRDAALAHIPENLRSYIRCFTARHKTGYKPHPDDVLSQYRATLESNAPRVTWDAPLRTMQLLKEERIDSVVTFNDTTVPMTAMRALKIKPRYPTPLTAYVPSPRQTGATSTLYLDVGMQPIPTVDDLVYNAFHGISRMHTMGERPAIMFQAMGEHEKMAQPKFMAAQTILEALKIHADETTGLPVAFDVVGFGKARDTNMPTPRQAPNIYVCSAEVGNHVATSVNEHYRDAFHLLKKYLRNTLRSPAFAPAGAINLLSNLALLPHLSEQRDRMMITARSLTGFYMGTPVIKINSDTDSENIGSAVLGAAQIGAYGQKMLRQERGIMEDLKNTYQVFKKTTEFTSIMHRYRKDQLIMRIAELTKDGIDPRKPLTTQLEALLEEEEGQKALQPDPKDI